MFSAIVRAAIPAIVVLFFAWARRHVSGQERKPSNRYDEIDSAGMSAYVNVAQILVGVAFGFGTFFLCKAINRQIALAHGVPQLLIPADGVYWCFLCGFGALTLLWEITYRLWRAYDADAADAYLAYSDAKTGFGVTKVLRWMALLITLPVAIFTMLCLPIHASFYQDGFWLARFSQFKPEFHPYGSIQDFQVIDGDIIRDGSFSPRPRLFLTFQDGTTWDSSRTREDRPVDPRLIAFLTSKLGHTPEHLHTSPK